MRAGPAGRSSPRSASSLGLGLELAFVVGLLVAIGMVGALWWLGTVGMPHAGLRRLDRRELSRRFAHTLVPIAAAYVVAHYFSLLAYNGQDLWRLASDPLGDGSDLFGGAGASIDYSILTATAIWYVQVLALVAGHVAALVLAHDRALVVYGSAEGGGPLADRHAGADGLLHLPRPLAALGRAERIVDVLVLAHAGHWLSQLIYLVPLAVLIGVILAGRIRDRREAAHEQVRADQRRVRIDPPRRRGTSAAMLSRRAVRPLERRPRRGQHGLRRLVRGARPHDLRGLPRRRGPRRRGRGRAQRERRAGARRRLTDPARLRSSRQPPRDVVRSAGQRAGRRPRNEALMSVDELRFLLDGVPDTRELVIRRADGWAPERDAWRDAHEDAAAAYRAWRRDAQRRRPTPLPRRAGPRGRGPGRARRRSLTATSAEHGCAGVAVGGSPSCPPGAARASLRSSAPGGPAASRPRTLGQPPGRTPPSLVCLGGGACQTIVWAICSVKGRDLRLRSRVTVPVSRDRARRDRLNDCPRSGCVRACAQFDCRVRIGCEQWVCQASRVALDAPCGCRHSPRS